MLPAFSRRLSANRFGKPDLVIRLRLANSCSLFNKVHLIKRGVISFVLAHITIFIVGLSSKLNQLVVQPGNIYATGTQVAYEKRSNQHSATKTYKPLTFAICIINPVKSHKELAQVTTSEEFVKYQMNNFNLRNTASSKSCLRKTNTLLLLDLLMKINFSLTIRKSFQVNLVTTENSQLSL